MAKSWIVGLTRHQHLNVARLNLKQQGYRTRLPLFYRHPSHPLFEKARMGLRFGSRYILIEADIEAGEIAPINHTRGMDDSNRGQAVVGTWTNEDFRPHILRPAYMHMIEDLQIAEALEALATKAPEPRDDLVPGDHVVIIGDRGRVGYGLEGRLKECVRGTAVIFCGNQKITLPECDLKKIEHDAKRAA
jgi:hypothetical protein